MARRKKFIVGLVCMATAAATVVAIAFALQDSIHAGSCARIQKGMTETEVAQILGRPCDREHPYCPEIVTVLESDGTCRQVRRFIAGKTWDGHTGSITVHFEKPGIVTNARFDENQDSFYRKVRRFLRLEESPIYEMIELDELQNP